ncbi:MAG: hypothetical protein CMD14_06425 [Flavobacteriales bacterium]|nr:hypothetical protein [Flavobacteriales bacterium]|tara:strand:+ start:197 stop:493 length:297 start_codon:yes stop_codon:yes gene_type:complete
MNDMSNNMNAMSNNMNAMSNNMNAMSNNNEQCDKSAMMIFNLIDNLILEMVEQPIKKHSTTKVKQTNGDDSCGTYGYGNHRNPKYIGMKEQIDERGNR